MRPACSRTRSGKIGRRDEAGKLFAEITLISTLSETQYHYASFLAAEGQPAEARAWAQRILAKKPTMPNYIRRRERPWFRKANALLRRLRLSGVAASYNVAVVGHRSDKLWRASGEAERACRP